MPPTDPRFLEMLPEDIETDYWAYHYDANPAADSMEDETYDTEEIIAQMNKGDWEEVING